MSILSLELIKNRIDINIPFCDIPELLKICNQNNMPYNSKFLEILIQCKTLNRSLPEEWENIYFIVP